jgi:hypothetical protein
MDHTHHATDQASTRAPPTLLCRNRASPKKLKAYQSHATPDAAGFVSSAAVRYSICPSTLCLGRLRTCEHHDEFITLPIKRRGPTRLGTGNVTRRQVPFCCAQRDLPSRDEMAAIASCSTNDADAVDPVTTVGNHNSIVGFRVIISA